MSLFTSGDRETMGPKDAAHHSESRRHRDLIRVALPVLVVACVLVRLGLIDRQGLWADELFSLAMATGHSLEHPADKADPAWAISLNCRGPAHPRPTAVTSSTRTLPPVPPAWSGPCYSPTPALPCITWCSMHGRGLLGTS